VLLSKLYKEKRCIDYMKRMNKTGQQMTLGTIIAIVLGVAVLVFLIFGFSTGWNNLWSKVTAFGGTDVNIDTINQACALACSTQSSSAYCNQVRTVKFGEEVGVEEDCADNAAESRKTCANTCENLADSGISKINVAPCPGLC